MSDQRSPLVSHPGPTSGTPHAIAPDLKRLGGQTPTLPVLVFMVGLKLIHTWLLGKFPPNSPLQLAVVAFPLIAIAMAAIDWPF